MTSQRWMICVFVLTFQNLQQMCRCSKHVRSICLQTYRSIAVVSGVFVQFNACFFFCVIKSKWIYDSWIQLEKMQNLFLLSKICLFNRRLKRKFQNPCKWFMKTHIQLSDWIQPHFRNNIRHRTGFISGINGISTGICFFEIATQFTKSDYEEKIKCPAK